MTDPLADLDADPALAAAVLELEEHHAGEGWDRPARLYALVDTASLIRQEPGLAGQLGLDPDAQAGSLTAVEQDHVGGEEQPLEQVLETISWPPSVVGAAAVVERLVLPPGADSELPDDPHAQQSFAEVHPGRQDVRIVAGATRGGSTYCALRLRAHDDQASVVSGIDLVPGLLALLQATLLDDNGTHSGNDARGERG
jgi:hypothetical protein